jgi:hypothetical protein
VKVGSLITMVGPGDRSVARYPDRMGRSLAFGLIAAIGSAALLPLAPAVGLLALAVAAWSRRPMRPWRCPECARRARARRFWP